MNTTDWSAMILRDVAREYDMCSNELMADTLSHHF